MDVKLEKHYGADVFVSAQAEAGRKTGCLCVHQEPIYPEKPELGTKTVMCAHLKKSIELQSIHEKILGKASADTLRKRQAQIDLVDLVRGGKPITDEGRCMLASVSFLICVTGNLAVATARCPHYKPEEPIASSE